MGKVITLPPVILKNGMVLDQVFQCPYFTYICMSGELGVIPNEMPDFEFVVDCTPVNGGSNAPT